jgi:hypothetical protein
VSNEFKHADPGKQSPFLMVHSDGIFDKGCEFLSYIWQQFLCDSPQFLGMQTLVKLCVVFAEMKWVSWKPSKKTINKWNNLVKRYSKQPEQNELQTLAWKFVSYILSDKCDLEVQVLTKEKSAIFFVDLKNSPLFGLSDHGIVYMNRTLERRYSSGMVLQTLVHEACHAIRQKILPDVFELSEVPDKDFSRSHPLYPLYIKEEYIAYVLEASLFGANAHKRAVKSILEGPYDAVADDLTDFCIETTDLISFLKAQTLSQSRNLTDTTAYKLGRNAEILDIHVDYQ